MRSALRRILDEDWIVVLASGIALGYATLDLARSVGFTVAMWIRGLEEDESDTLRSFPDPRDVDWGQITGSLVTFLLVLIAVALVVRALPRKAEEPE